uniref:Secreted protein n=1 Tax=Achlya hypogyna TaxID=1202772 RepID=A0A0A7CMU4_ACHHY|nr:secreted protein [Achlya hypogyna]
MSRVLLLLIASFVLAAFATHVRMPSKVDPALAAAFESADRVNIMVDLDGSTDCIENESGDNSDYVAKLQAFTAARQESVQALLATLPDEYEGTPKFFWITNKVSVLVMELADLPAVTAIRGEFVAHISGGGAIASHDNL